MTETVLAFLQDARHHGDVCQPLDWIPEIYHFIGGGEAVIPDALLYYRRGGDDWTQARLRPGAAQEEWRRHYPIFPRLLFVLDCTGPAGIENRISALHAAARDQTAVGFRHEVPVLAAGAARAAPPRARTSTAVAEVPLCQWCMTPVREKWGPYVRYTSTRAQALPGRS
ncbi:hypothetical protein QQS16_35815 [Streptomyces sp. ALI-76-A]|nr:hypothetical protein [Streptomyces sp. ALI-76-A]MDL5205344.1 hypothetical protein [Streptomyces sp. ALI-76-A]